MRIFALAFALLCSLFSLNQTAQAAVTISIDLSSQTMNVQSDKTGESINWAISSGRSGYVTPRGSFKPYSLQRMHYSRKYNNSPMPHSIFFRGGYAIHGTGAVSQLGRPASHGCIRLPSKMAPILFDHVALGTPVTITGKGPDYATYLKQSAERAKANAAKYAAAKKKQADADAKKAADAAANGTTPPAADPNAPVVKPAIPELKVPEPPPIGAPVQVKPALPVPAGTGQQ